MRSSLIGLILFFCASSGQATNPGFCGNLDLREITNSELVDVIFTQDLAKNRTLARTQCGIPGEQLAICSSCSGTTTPQMMTHLRPILGAENHLKWHSTWHKIRQFEAMSPEVYQQLQAAGSVPATMPLESFRTAHIGRGTQSGEDFLYMHRMMIKMVQVELAAAQLPCMAPWENLPASVQDEAWPVPKNWASVSDSQKANTELKQFQAQLERFREPERLKKISLNQLGQMIEPSLHQNLHNFYRGNPLCSREAKAEGYCDDLLPVETSPLNKHFWKIHGLIDQLIGDWLTAHGYSEISKNCSGIKACYQWQGTWVGRYPQETR